MSDLFEQAAQERTARNAPLAARLRPRELAEFFGQDRAVAFLRRMAEAGRPTSLLLWGPPGTGKTTLAGLVARKTGGRYVARSAVRVGVADVKKILEEARSTRSMEGKETVLFLDEIHRFNRAQQDALLHAVEDGSVTLIGATTENPSFSVNRALLSRCRVVALEPLSEAALGRVTDRALAHLGVELAPDARRVLIKRATGDARALLNVLEVAAQLRSDEGTIDVALVERAAGPRVLLHDKDGELHHNVTSAFIKTMRAGRSEAAVYWLARMLEAGEAPEFVARRLVIFASEDVGNADPQALSVAVACQQAVSFVGLPEATYALSQCTLYLAQAPKSRAAGDAYAAARDKVREDGATPVPRHLHRNPKPSGQS